MENINSGLKYSLISPINYLKQDKIRLILLIFIIFLLSLIHSFLSVNITFNNSEEIPNIIKQTKLDPFRLKIVIFIFTLIGILISSFVGYFILACIFKIIFIMFNLQITFKKVFYLCLYLAFIGCLSNLINSFFSFLFNNSQVTIYSNLSMISNNPFLKSFLQIIDPFILFQFYIIYNFLNDVLKAKKKFSIIFLILYVSIIFLTLYLGSVSK